MEEELFKAKNAKLSADLVNHKKHTSQLISILDGIKRAAGRGEYNFNGDGVLMSVTLEELKKLGYTVQTGSHVNEDNYSISWK